jgi:hypothetical protein
VPGYPNEDRRAEPADVDAEFEGGGGDDGFDRAVAQSLLDLAALVREVAGAITANDLGFEDLRFSFYF